MAPRTLRVTTSDGIDRDVELVDVNWDIGHKLLDAVRMPDEPLPHPKRDRMVRDWYRATSAWMIVTENRRRLAGRVETSVQAGTAVTSECATAAL